MACTAQGSVYGQVTNTNGDGLSDVDVKAKLNNSIIANATTDNNGCYTLYGLTTNTTYQLCFTKIGYNDISDEYVNITTPPVLHDVTMKKQKRMTANRHDRRD